MTDIESIHMSVTAAIAVAFAVGAPLLAYIVRGKDRELAKLHDKHSALAAAHEAAKASMASREQATASKHHELELLVARLESEVQTASRIGQKVDTLANKLDRLVAEFGELKGALRATGRLSTGRSSPRVPVVSDPPSRRR